MKKCLMLFLCFKAGICLAQHHHKPEKAWSHVPVFKQSFADSSFLGKEMQVVIFTVPPGAVDSIPHQHNCHLTGFILQGRVITRLKNKAEQTLNEGDVFYEFPNEIHESLKNPDKLREAKILLYYLYEKGAVLYKKLN